MTLGESPGSCIVARGSVWQRQLERSYRSLNTWRGGWVVALVRQAASQWCMLYQSQTTADQAADGWEARTGQEQGEGNVPA
jgi:hypothetical protein